MPAAPKLNNPTFNRGQHNGVAVGYHSRTVFSYATDTPINLFETVMVDDSTTDGIQFLIDNSGANDSHGTHIIPSYYWRPGKTFRVSGTIIANNISGEGGNEYLNMRFGLSPGDGVISIQWLAIQNNDYNHQFAEDEGPLPVYFSCDIYCSKILSNDLDANFGASGYYQYNYSDYNGIGSNGGSSYVPVYRAAGIYTGMEETYINQSTIMFNLFGTNLNGGAKITQLLIEELA
jgi:hypothetical protein